MNFRHLLCLLLFGALVAFAAEASYSKEKLRGHWRFQDEEKGITADYTFREDDSFVAELREGGSLVRRFEGKWRIEDEWLIYTYEKDSLGQVGDGARERDRLLSLDDSSYSIEGGDRSVRTYFRVKEKS